MILITSIYDKCFICSMTGKTGSFGEVRFGTFGETWQKTQKSVLSSQFTKCGTHSTLRKLQTA